jgi:hypothetical protein
MSARELEQIARYREHLAIRLVECRVPDSLHEGLLAYFTERRPTGSFLEACLTNDLMKAATRADEINAPALHLIVRFLYNHAPSPAWGSPEAVQAWLADEQPVPTPFD